MAKAPKQVDKLKYEEAIVELETILDQVESGEIDLEAALNYTERGTALIKHCRGILDRVEKRVAELTLDDNGQWQHADQK